jgi:DNA-binding PadR family transcriptional regulator
MSPGGAVVKTHWFHILLSLAGEPRYGSAIRDDVQRISDGGVRLWPATLYGSLEELLERGWIDELPEADQPDERQGRERFYRLTRAGRTALEDELGRLEELAGLARSRLSGETAP